MLRINIPSDGPSKINFSNFENYQLPIPPNGMDSEINNDVILLFEDEEEALAYADVLKQLPGSQKKVSNEIISAIEHDEFVQPYIQ